MKSKQTSLITLTLTLLMIMFSFGSASAGEASQPEADIQSIIDTYYITSEDC